MIALIARFLPSLLPAVSAIFNPWWILVFAAVTGFAWFRGYQVGADKLETYRTEQFTAATKINGKRAGVTAAVEARYIERSGKTEYVTRWYEKETQDYADENPDNLCLDDRWRRLHDGAAANAIPDAASGPNAALRAPTRPAEGLSRPDGR